MASIYTKNSSGSLVPAASYPGPIGPAGSTGPAGQASSLSIGTVTTGNPGTQASATITGTAPSQVLNLTIPAGTSGSGSVSTVNSIQPVSGNVTLTFSDITGTVGDGNLPARLQAVPTMVSSWDNAVTDGFYGGRNALSEPPDNQDSWYTGYVTTYDNTGLYVVQVITCGFGQNVGKTYTRVQNNGQWSAWVELISASSIGTTVQAYSANLTAFASKTAPAGTVVGTFDTQTLVSKTLSSPKVNTLLDLNGATILSLNGVSSSANFISVSNAAAGASPTFTVSGNDTNVNLNLVTKGTGVVQANGAQVATANDLYFDFMGAM